ncbi:ABC transporter ATP-binding protein [Methylicorpusculum sp.]|uniref:ABC transporter ATP-binding protein n=1 Tax=Methylicorpusculum sp. TaxID=2713644 RepID=UPI00271B03CB|nr:ABC transporter ATP-binding protein [Methylicorpusculum sp.]MDO8843245.1 ABC transporter ATP-binding protein [Methylicorpusculum sp.]
MTNIAIKVENLSKCYQIYDTPRDRLKQFVAPRLQRLTWQPPKQYFREFWALKDISFEIKKGETVGIIGRNGSGKSTLLQMICGTLNPTSGSIQTSGRIAALLELGSGFNPDFTGRENVYMNAAVLGLTQDEIDKRYDDIVAFADIGEFINQPVKTYSSGMVVRLAFAVQSQIDPDILIVDEALSVGDAKFQAKCFDRLRQLKENGTSILLVTHSSEQIVTHCSTAILLNNGTQLETGEPRSVINRYMDLLFGKEKKTPASLATQSAKASSPAGIKSTYALSNSEDLFFTRVGYNPHEYRWGDGTATILDFYLAADDDTYPSAVSTGQKITMAISIRFHNDFYRPILGITIKTKEGVTVYGVNSETLDCDDFIKLGRSESVIQIQAAFNCLLAPGDYFISLGLASKHGEEVIPHDRRYDSIHLHVRPNTRFFGLTDLELIMNAKEVVA